MTGGEAFRRREGRLGRKGLIFLGFLELFFHFQHFLVISSTPLSFFQSAGGLECFPATVVLIFRRSELLLKVGDNFLSSFVISACSNFMSHLPFPSSCSSSAGHLRADSGEFWTAAGSSEAPSCVLELCKLDPCLL